MEEYFFPSDHGVKIKGLDVRKKILCFFLLLLFKITINHSFPSEQIHLLVLFSAFFVGDLLKNFV